MVTPVRVFDIIRDPLYGSIPLDPLARLLVDTVAFQRLRRIRQLAMASEAYPSAMHTRFEHAVGVYHLSGLVISSMASRQPGAFSDEEAALTRAACLLHDLGHFSGAHLLEEVEYLGSSHEDAGAEWFHTGAIGKVVRAHLGAAAPGAISALVAGHSSLPLAGVVSGACDADKMDYIARDAYHCGLPQGYDRDLLMHSLAVLPHPGTGAAVIGMESVGVPAFESMLYAKFNLYRSVYFHPAARSATAMMRAILVSALDARLITMPELMHWTDDEIFTLLRHRVARKRGDSARHVRDMIKRLLSRSLYKPSVSMPLSAVPGLRGHSMITASERALESALGLAHGDVIVDIPSKPRMLSMDIPVRLPDGRVVMADALGPEEGFALAASREDMYACSGRVRVFTPSRMEISQEILSRCLPGA